MNCQSCDRVADRVQCVLWSCDENPTVCDQLCLQISRINLGSPGTRLATWFLSDGTNTRLTKFVTPIIVSSRAGICLPLYLCPCVLLPFVPPPLPTENFNWDIVQLGHHL